MGMRVDIDVSQHRGISANSKCSWDGIVHRNGTWWLFDGELSWKRSLARRPGSNLVLKEFPIYSHLSPACLSLELPSENIAGLGSNNRELWGPLRARATKDSVKECGGVGPAVNQGHPKAFQHCPAPRWQKVLITAHALPFTGENPWGIYLNFLLLEVSQDTWVSFKACWVPLPISQVSELRSIGHWVNEASLR